MNRRLVIFDLDGTLTVPTLDFDAIRREIGLVSGPILEQLDGLDAKQRAHAESIIDAHEELAARTAVLQEGALEMLARLRSQGFALAVLTRNARRRVEHVLDRFEIAVDAMRTRDDGAIKPSAAPVLSLCEQLMAEPARSWMVGDYLFDVLSGKQAGARTVLMIGDLPTPAYAAEADYVIRRLAELPGIVAAIPTA